MCKEGGPDQVVVATSTYLSSFWLLLFAAACQNEAMVLTQAAAFLRARFLLCLAS